MQVEDCWEYALEAIMYDVIPNSIHKVIKLSLYEHLICIIEYVIRLWNYILMLFILELSLVVEVVLDT